jgi:hypothetical protein
MIPGVGQNTLTASLSTHPLAVVGAAIGVPASIRIENARNFDSIRHLKSRGYAVPGEALAVHIASDESPLVLHDILAAEHALALLGIVSPVPLVHVAIAEPIHASALTQAYRGQGR